MLQLGGGGGRGAASRPPWAKTYKNTHANTNSCTAAPPPEGWGWNWRDSDARELALRALLRFLLVERVAQSGARKALLPA